MTASLRFDRTRDLFQAHPAMREEITAVPADTDVVAFLRELLASPTPEDAIILCAYALNPREAIWWGHECVRAVPAACAAEEDQQFLFLAQTWVREPHEEHRRACLIAGLASAPKSPAAWIALAVGWCPTSDPSDERTVPPLGVMPRALATAILAALARVPRSLRAATLGMFVTMGLEIAVAAGHAA